MPLLYLGNGLALAQPIVREPRSEMLLRFKHRNMSVACQLGTAIVDFLMSPSKRSQSRALTASTLGRTLTSKPLGEFHY